MHAWCKLAVGWWNRIVARPDADLVKQVLKANIQEAHRRIEDGVICASVQQQPSRSWASSFYHMIGSIDAVLAADVLQMERISVADVLQRVHEGWHGATWGEWAELPQAAPPLRSMPEQATQGFKSATYRSWFCPGSLEKGQGFAYHAHTPQHVKA